MKLLYYCNFWKNLIIVINNDSKKLIYNNRILSASQVKVLNNECQNLKTYYFLYFHFSKSYQMLFVNFRYFYNMNSLMVTSYYIINIIVYLIKNKNLNKLIKICINYNK